MSRSWDKQALGDWHGRRVVVTGANSGIGFHTALELGRAGASVIAACRDAERGASALAQLRAAAPGAVFQLAPLDLASLQSVRDFAAGLLADGKPLDLLVNNAGVMMPPRHAVTTEGFELQFGTNHLGHFALTGLLLPALQASAAPRVVGVSSLAAQMGKMAFDDLQWTQHYRPWAAYAQSKLANLLFLFELGRRAPWLRVMAAHPGGSNTGLQKYAFKTLTRLGGQSAAQGAWPSLAAAVSDLPSGTYFGPKHFFHLRGAPVVVRPPRHAQNLESARRLWTVSEHLTGVHYDLAPAPGSLAA